MRLTMRRISEVNTIPDIRERNDRPRDKQPKHQVTSTVQRQMVQKFVKELSDSAKQPDRSDSAERTATEQVETTVREIVYEAVQLPRRAIQHPARKESADSSAGVQPEQSDQPHHAPESPRERTDAPRTRSDATPPQSTSIPAAQEQARRAYVQQTAKTATPAPPITSEQPQHTTVTVPSAENAPRQRTEDVRTRPDPKQPQSASAPTPQEQARQAFVEKQAQLSQNPSIESIYPSEPADPILPQPPVSEAPAITPERQPLTAGSKPAPPVQPPTPAHTPPVEQLPAIREKPKPNAAPREKPRRDVSIRTRDTEQIAPPTAQPKTSVSKIDIGVKSMVFCLRSQP